MDSNRFIVITTIFPPTQAVSRFARMDGWRLVVAGDRKTPADWSCPGAEFLAADASQTAEYRISRALPWNHYSRKMIGYVHAIRNGAQIIADTDDDNLPREDWGFPVFDGEFDTTPDDQGFLNVYRLYSDRHIWPRGFPLQLITDLGRRPDRTNLIRRACRVGVWQGLADGDPDVDAIYRLTDNRPCQFENRPPVVLGRGTCSPFNSQNTAFRRELFPLLYLPAHVTFRFTDILRGLVAQPILWIEDRRLGFTRATVAQERNPHDYLRDFESEIPCYLHVTHVMDIVNSAVAAGRNIGDNLHRAYSELVRAGLVPEREIPVLEAWLGDIGF